MIVKSSNRCDSQYFFVYERGVFESMSLTGHSKIETFPLFRHVLWLLKKWYHEMWYLDSVVHFLYPLLNCYIPFWNLLNWWSFSYPLHHHTWTIASLVTWFKLYGTSMSVLRVFTAFFDIIFLFLFVNHREIAKAATKASGHSEGAERTASRWAVQAASSQWWNWKVIQGEDTQARGTP